mgnify:CR=1 FL=1
MFLTRPTLHVLLFVAASALAACGEFIKDDVDFDVDNRTADITVENSESMALDLLQAGFMSFRFSIYDKYLDANALPFESISNDPDKYPCSESGTVIASYTRAAGDEHKKGDKLTLEYDKCNTGDGFTHTGSVKGKYLSVEGYNKGFADLTLSDCVAIFTEEFELDRIIQENAYDMSVYKQGPNVVIEYLDLNSETNTSEVRSRYEVTAQEQVLVINSNPDAEITFYQVEDLVEEILDCQGYERRLELDLELETRSVEGETEFELADPIVFKLKGSVEFYQSPAFGSEQGVVEADEFDISWNQNQSVNEFSFENIQVNLRFAAEAESYRINTSGEVGIRKDGISTGVVQIDNIQSIEGYEDELYPIGGTYLIRGRVSNGITESAEQIRVDLFDASVSLLISPEGDENGSGQADFTTQAALLWDDFWNRNFVFAEN